MRYLDDNPLTVEEFNTYTDKMTVVDEFDAPYRITVECTVDQYERGMSPIVRGIEIFDEDLQAWKVFALDSYPYESELDISFLSEELPKGLTLDEALDWCTEE